MNKPPVFTKKQTILRIFLLVFVVILTIVLIIYREEVSALESLGYPGIFLVSLLANATVLIPIPGVMFTSAMGAVFHPFFVALSAGSGAALGEVSGYLAGVGSQVVLDRSERYRRMKEWITRSNGWPVILLAFIPNPLFDAAGFIAGSTKMPLWKFLLFTFIGKFGKMLMFAYLGTGILRLFVH